MTDKSEATNFGLVDYALAIIGSLIGSYLGICAAHYFIFGKWELINV